MPYFTNEEWQAILRNVADPKQGAAMIGCTRDAIGAIGRSLSDKAMEVVSIRDYDGAYGDGIHDDTTAFVKAINDITNSGQRATLHLPRATAWRLTKGLTVDISYVNFLQEGTPIDATELTSSICDAAFTFIGSETPNYPKNVAIIESIKIEGPGYGSGVNAFSFQQTGTPSGKRGTPGITVERCNIQKFAKGMTFGNSVYSMNLRSNDIYYCDICLDYPTGSDSGEAIQVFGGSLFNSRIMVKVGSGSVIELHAVHCDYTANTYGFDRRIFDIDGGRVYMFGGWLESTNHQEPLILVQGNGGVFKMFGGGCSLASVTAATPWASGTTYVANDRIWQVSSNTGYRWKCTTGGVSGGAEPAWTASPVYGVTTVVDNGVTWTFDGGIPNYIVEVNADTAEYASATFDGTFMHNLQTSSGHLAYTHGAGSGFASIRNRDGFNQHYCEYILGSAENQLRDGSFEEATLIDDVTIHNDTVLPTPSRTVGTNISIGVSAAQVRTGSQSLLATTGAGNKGSFMFVAPIEPGALGNFELYYKKPGAETGDISINHYYAVMDRNGNAIPVMKTYLQVAANDITFTADAVDWTRAAGIHTMVRAPHWATHTVVVVNMDAFPSANLYVDDVIMSVM